MIKFSLVFLKIKLKETAIKENFVRKEIESTLLYCTLLIYKIYIRDMNLFLYLLLLIK
jgi:hypothetical protein